MVVGARQSFQIFRQNTWFLGKNRALSNFLYGILHYLISITRLKKNQVIKFNFISTTRAILNSLHNYFVLGLTWQATLKMPHVKFDLLTDTDTYLLTEKGTHGGLSVIKHYTDKETFRKWRTMVKISQSKKMKFSIKDFFSKWDSFLLFRFNSVNFFSFLQICSHLLKKSLMQNFFLQ